MAVAERMGIETGVDLYKIMDVAEDRVLPIMDQQIRVDRDSLLIGYTGVYSTFLLFAQRAAARYGVSSRDILAEMAEMTAEVIGRTLFGREVGQRAAHTVVEAFSAYQARVGQTAPDRH